ncbi:hypothetical protein OEB99_07545 [Actinotalea sp. M2MS4P-6]|uniref:Trm112 family protein n=1 Tax=Actinotalea sp. M2MS4P-6 TaxID=2983762 RepID=UPI0021E4D64D|nr:Trm112 family protein [Actinotalea sp. M2MS4P-6]MCV2394156.1 hypothetical protein [Actinotalea sp. M2MS4P-6]
MTELPGWARELLRCPACHATLADADGSLACTGCARVYPVRDGVPVLLVDEAEPGPTGEV